MRKILHAILKKQKCRLWNGYVENMDRKFIVVGATGVSLAQITNGDKSYLVAVRQKVTGKRDRGWVGCKMKGTAHAHSIANKNLLYADQK